VNHSLRAAAALPVVLALAACSPAAAQPSWTFGPGATPPPTEAPAAEAVAAEPTPEPATPTPAPTEPPLGTEEAPREIDVTMGNFLFDPASVTVHQGETIRFVVSNPTTITHELVLGDAEEQEHHAEEMAEMQEMASDGHDHMAAEPNELEVEAGTTGAIVWTFDTAGEFLMGCHVPGHWEAGMKGAIEVLP